MVAWDLVNRSVLLGATTVQTTRSAPYFRAVFALEQVLAGARSCESATVIGVPRSEVTPYMSRVLRNCSPTRLVSFPSFCAAA